MNDARTPKGSEQPNRGPDIARLLAADHERIWLEPKCVGEDRTWCQDNVWGEGCGDTGCAFEAPPTEYIRADLVRGAETTALRRAAEVADIWAKTEAVEGEQAAFIASVVRFTAAKIAAQIRALDSSDAGAASASSPESSLPESNNQSETP